MKKEIILIALIILLVVGGGLGAISLRHKIERGRKSETKIENDFLKVPEYSTEKSTSTYDDGNSYWFVLVEEKNGSLKLNTFVKQNHKYFSVQEAKATFKKDVFILDFIEVSKETYEHNGGE